ncbi:hypothetical protein HDU92_002909 [Lobulomyces angularis]|nr:hypothetical protein HDU92_002909 [Lobulomyces angularis]
MKMTKPHSTSSLNLNEYHSKEKKYDTQHSKRHSLKNRKSFNFFKFNFSNSDKHNKRDALDAKSVISVKSIKTFKSFFSKESDDDDANSVCPIEDNVHNIIDTDNETFPNHIKVTPRISLRKLLTYKKDLNDDDDSLTDETASSLKIDNLDEISVFKNHISVFTTLTRGPQNFGLNIPEASPLKNRLRIVEEVSDSDEISLVNCDVNKVAILEDSEDYDHIEDIYSSYADIPCQSTQKLDEYHLTAEKNVDDLSNDSGETTKNEISLQSTKISELSSNNYKDGHQVLDNIPIDVTSVKKEKKKSAEKNSVKILSAEKISSQNPNFQHKGNELTSMISTVDEKYLVDSDSINNEPTLSNEPTLENNEEDASSSDVIQDEKKYNEVLDKTKIPFYFISKKSANKKKNNDVKKVKLKPDTSFQSMRDSRKSFIFSEEEVKDLRRYVHY